ncbi:MAG: cupin domain-containing protein [Pyrinomonadaceae bacterium]
MEEVFGPDDLTEPAAAFALGALEPEETTAFAQLAAVNPNAAREVRAFRSVVDALALNVPLTAPPAGLRQRLLSSLGEQDVAEAASSSAATDRWVVRASEGIWQEMEPGVQVKVLYKDKSRDTITTLVKLEAGARIPRHYHDGGEECYVISGDIYDDNISMNAGDYISLMRDTMHSFVSTINGALLLIISPLGHDGAVTI